MNNASCDLARWEGQARFRENAVNDFFRAIVVLDMQSTAPAGEFTAQELGLGSRRVFLVFDMKSFREVDALLDQTVDSFRVRYKMHNYHPLRNRLPREINHAIRTGGRIDKLISFRLSVESKTRLVAREGSTGRLPVRHDCRN
jgi:hypothetical protein